jgi:hypothetical protein
MATPLDTELYEKVKKYVYSIYDKPSAYRSGAVVRLYKELGGKYRDDGKPKHLKRWFQEKWTDVSTLQEPHYPLYRPTVRVNKSTPRTIHEIPQERIEYLSTLKNKIKKKKLPSF